MMTDETDRIDALDFLRGLAVMGILLANITIFALPQIAFLNPFAIGMNGPADTAAWLLNLLLIDGKMRALFAMLLGASILLVMERAELAGRDGGAANLRRLLWLIPIGMAHFVLLWSGDILVSLAIAGLIAMRFVRLEPFALVKWALGLLALQWLINLTWILPDFWMRGAALAPGASAEMVALWQHHAAALGIGGGGAVQGDLTLFRSGYGAIVAARLAEGGLAMRNIVLFALPELLAFIALGMAMLKGGFLAGHWSRAEYRAIWRRGYLVGLVPMAGLALWVLLSRDPLAAQASAFGWSVPLRLPLAVAHAALVMDLATRFPAHRLVAGMRAVGRLALSNYLLCSLAMTTLFYGYGGDLYGKFGRAALLEIAVFFCGVMLLWSVLWRRRFHYGPAEWLWRRLARGLAAR